MPFAYSLDIARLSHAYETHALTPGRVVRDVLAEVDASRASNPVWIHVIALESLLERAAHLEGRRANGERLPLYGLPFAVKDNIDIAGEPTTAACPAYSYVASETAYAVQRLEQAGAICIGKTNMDQFATGLVGTRSPYGACKNPFDPRYISGGSSSGSALAVALGHVSFALGTDTAGSGRVPAAFCNIVGLKPTRGLVSMRGVVPACRSLDCISIFALTVEDAAAVYDLATAADADDPYSRSRELKALHVPARLRCGVPRAADLQFFGDAAAESAFGRALETMQSLGAELVEIDYAPFAETARLLYEGPWVAERLAAIQPFFDSSAREIHPVVRDIIAGGARFSAVDAFEAQYKLQALRALADAQFSRMDMMLTPTAGTIYRLDEIERDPVRRNSDLGLYTNFVNLLDLAALAVPAGFRDDRLPFGVTLIAPAHEELLLTHWGARFHRASTATLGATAFTPPAYTGSGSVGQDAHVTLAVVGAHLSGMPLNHQLTSRGARLIEACSTAPRYRLYALSESAPAKPGLACVSNGSGAAIEVELWSVPVERFGSFVAEIPPPLAIGTVTLADGREVKGFVCESYALEGARDISDLGGWRSYLAQRH